MRRVKPIAFGVILAALLVSDFVTWSKLHHAMSWFLGDLGMAAAAAVLLLANAVTAAFFLQELDRSLIRRLHIVAGFLYCTIGLAVYASAVETGSIHFPDSLAGTAFNASPAVAVIGGALVVGTALAIITFMFWSVLGVLIQKMVTTEAARGDVVWQARAEQAGITTDNILGIDQAQTAARRRASGS